MLRFKYVAPVHAGDTISSASHNNLALAFNQRILSGAGDAAWRIVWNAHSLMRQVRNPSGDFLLPGTQQWPASDEWWKMYALVDNSNRCGEHNDAWYWPIAAPGEEEGANIANPMMAFVFGRDYVGPNTRDVEPEANRLTDGPSDNDNNFQPIDVASLSGNPDIDAASTWAQAKSQRGYIERTSPYRAHAPAYEAAHSAYSWRYGSKAPYLKNYTSFAPVPKDEGSCPRINGITPSYWHAKFTPLIPGYPTLSFPACPGVSGHIQYIARLTDRYILYFQDAPTLMLPYTVYLEGPYDGGGALAKSHSEILTMALNKFVIEMRGSYANRVDDGCYQIENNAFDFQRFLSTQYALAPAGCGQINTQTGQLESLGYPTYSIAFSAAGNEQEIPANTIMPLSLGHPGDSGTRHYFGAPFVFSAVMVRVSGITSGFEIEFLDEADNPVHLGQPVKPCEPASRNILSLSVPSAPETTRTLVVFLGAPINPGNLRARIKTPTRLVRGGSIVVEILEQIAYLPDVQDAYAVLRCGTTNGSEDSADNYGGVFDKEKLRNLSDTYFKYGCIVNLDGKLNIGRHDTAVNFNSIYESARQLVHENIRMVPRTQIEQYKVVDGNSELYFDRYAVGNGNNAPGTRTIETEVKPIIGSQVITPVSETELKPYIEYVVRRTGKDNIKPIGVADPSASNAVNLQTKLPFDCYTEQNPPVTYCDDYVLYGNVKYIAPGYNFAVSTTSASGFYPSDRDNNYDHVIVGLPIPTYNPEDQVPAGYILLTENGDVKTRVRNDSSRVKEYIDAFGQRRTEIVRAARIDWVSITTYGQLDGNSQRVTEWKNLTLHEPPQQNSGEPGNPGNFLYKNGFRYAVQARHWIQANNAWEDWKTIASGLSGDPNAQGTYGFDPLAQTDLGAGTYYVEYLPGYDKTVDVDVQYRVIAKPVVDFNTNALVLYQRAYFTPSQLTWSGQPNKKYRVRRHQLLANGTEETVEISSELTGRTTYFFVDAPSSICPVRIHPSHLANKDVYQINDAILHYYVYDEQNNLLHTWTPEQLRATAAPLFVVRPDNILPTEAGDLFGTYAETTLDRSGNPLYVTPDVPRLVNGTPGVRGLMYKVYGPTNNGTSGIRFTSPYYDSETEPYGDKYEQHVEVYANSTFIWVKERAPVVPNPCFDRPSPCVNPWFPSLWNFYGVEQVWLASGQTQPDTTDLVSQRARIFQHKRYFGDTGKLIENVAGCEPGQFLGVFAFNPTINSLTGQDNFRTLVMANECWYTGVSQIEDYPLYETVDDFVNASGLTAYGDAFYQTQWTPWSDATESTINGADVSWYVLRTGYERLHLQSLMVPAPGDYQVRGLGYLTYKGQKYYSGDSITFTADNLVYNVSDASMKLVTVTSIACNTLTFDFFANIAPGKDLGESELEDGVLYRVHKGKGIKYTKKVNEGWVETTVNPGNTFVWQEGDNSLTRLPANSPSQVRVVEGIRHKDEVPKKGASNEWCMFMSLNHYHPSISSIWKTDSYGDVMPFLHNRCHTYSSEIRGPFHTALSQQFCYGQFPPLVSEAPPGYTYLEGINFPYWSNRQIARDYYRSCQVYRQPYELQSVRLVYTPVEGQLDEDGNQKYTDNIVKVVIKGRIQYTKAASSSVNSTDDWSSDKRAAIRSEPYRTDENAIREYLQYSTEGHHCVKGMLGDSATSYDIFSLPDDPMGACHPRFYFVKLVPYVYEDGNNSVEQNKDSLIKVDPYVQMDLYLRAMCGGWMDIESLHEVNCDQGLSTSPVADYLYENLCYQAIRSYGAHIDVTPEIWEGKNFLPLKTLVQYDFDFSQASSGNEKLMMEYRTWLLDRCAWGPWNTYSGSISPNAQSTSVGGEGYSTPPIITVSAGIPAQFKYEPLASPVVLQANTTYFLFSDETSGGDYWHDRVFTNQQAVTYKAELATNGIYSVYPAKYVSSTLTVYNGTNDANSGFGLVSLRTGCVGCVKNGAITPVGDYGNKVNNISGRVGIRFTTGNTPITVYELGRMVVAGNAQTHTIRLMADDGVTQLTAVDIDMSSAIADPNDSTSWTPPILTPEITNGVLTDIKIEDSGKGLDSTKASLTKLYITSGVGAGAVAHINEIYPENYSPGPDDPSNSYPGGVKSIIVTNGGAGYASPVVVTFTNESFIDQNHFAAKAVATIGDLALDRVVVTSSGSGYTTATVILSGGGGTGAQATAELSNGSIAQITVTSPGKGYRSAPTVIISGDGQGAAGTAYLKLIESASGSIAKITVTPETVGNYGYAFPPEVQITGGDSGDDSAHGAYAVAKTQVLDMNDASGMRVIDVELVPAPYDGMASVTIPYDGPTMTKTEFRFTRLADWPNGVKNETAQEVEDIAVTASSLLSFYFLPDLPSNPHKYEIKRADFTYGTGCNRTPTTWTTLTGVNGISGPICDNNGNHYQYDDCTDNCACLWPDPSTDHLLPLSVPLQPNDIIGSTYRIKDLNEVGGSGHVTSVGLESGGSGYSAGTIAVIVGGGGDGATAGLTITDGVVTEITLLNSGSGYTQDPHIIISDPTGVGSGAKATAIADSKLVSYYLAWPMQPLVVYNVERRLFYRFDSDLSWHTLATGVRSPYIDNAPWEENFSKDISPDIIGNRQSLGVPVTIEATDQSSATPRTVNITANKSYKNVYINCTVKVAVPLEGQVGTVDVDFPVEEVVMFNEDGLTSFTYEDSRTFPQWDGRIVSFTYTISEVASATISWPTLSNHKLLVDNVQESELRYELHRVYETINESGSLLIDEVVATSRASGATAPDFNLSSDQESITVEWTGWLDDDHRRLDDCRNNIGISPNPRVTNTEKYRVVARWKDWPETRCIQDAQQNRPECTPLDSQIPCVNTNRQYRVETVVTAKNRWFTAMPMGINIERPQGFSPVPNTCTYAEMFNNFANAINKLLYVRLELPFTKRMRSVSQTSIPASFWSTPGLQECSGIGCLGSGTKRNVCPEEAVETTYGPWEEVPVSASVLAGASVGPTGWSVDGDCTGNMKMGTYRTATQFVVDPSQEAFSAIPDNLLENFDISNLALIGKRTDEYGNCRLRSGLYMSCAADSCCQHYSVEGSWCECQDEPGGPVYISQHCGCACRLKDDGTYARNECQTLWQSEGKCSVFMQGIIKAPNLPCGDAGWVGGNGVEGQMLCSSGAAWSSSNIVGIRSLVYMSFPLY